MSDSTGVFTSVQEQEKPATIPVTERFWLWLDLYGKDKVELEMTGKGEGSDGNGGYMRVRYFIRKTTTNEKCSDATPGSKSGVTE